MSETSQPPTPPVSTVARMLATVALLRGSGLDPDTATALVDAIAYLTASGDTDGAERLLRLVTTDPDTIAAAHVALSVPARRPAPEPDAPAPPTGDRPPAPLPRRIPRPYRDPGTPDLPAHPTTADGPGPRPAGAGGDPASLSETRRWREATAAQVLSLDYAVTGPDGRMTGVYTPVPIVHPSSWCDHLDTICAGCLTGWSEDHAVAVFRHGLHGATEGCRCPVCRTTIPTHSTSPTRPTRPSGAADPAGRDSAATGDPRPDSSTDGGPGWFGEERA